MVVALEALSVFYRANPVPKFLKLMPLKTL